MITQFPKAALVLAALLAAPIADASPRHGRGNGHGNGHGAWADGVFCPPGLANREPACVPPGQARRHGGDDDDDHDEADDDRDEAPARRTPAHEFADALDGAVRDALDGSGGGLSSDERRALAVIAGFTGLALAQQGRLPGLSELLGSAEPTMARAAFPDPIPTRPAWIEALADLPTVRPPLAAPLPAPTASLIPPPPPLADDVAGLAGRPLLDSGF